MEQEIACPGLNGNVLLRAESVPFSQLPAQSRLFTEYQNDPISLQTFYPSAVSSHTQIAERIPEVLANYHADRNLLCDALDEINRKLSAGDKTFEHIALLRSQDAVAVVTGQQTGLFTGPIYTIYKALSAVRAAECLRGRGFKAVPVFWAATEDHDFEEVSKAFILDCTGRLASIGADPKRDDDLSVGYVKLDDSVLENVRTLFDNLKPTEFTPELRKLVESAWAPGEPFGSAFAKTLSLLTAEYGLVILDPVNLTLKQLAAPIYLEAIDRSAEIVDAVSRRSEQLVADGYEAQVTIDESYFPLFWHADDGGRRALRRTSKGTLRTRDRKHEFSINELKAIAASEPAKLSPGVILRPVVQDHILPTVCYFGGGAEIAYFAQNSEAYRILGRPVTPILHRQSFTFVEAKHAKTLRKYGLGFLDLFQGIDQLLPQIVEKYLNTKTAATFAEVEENINRELNRLDRELSAIDPTLAENLANRRRKINYHIGALRKKFHNVQLKKDEIIHRQVDTMFEAILPAGNLQERTLNVAYFINQYGPRFIDWIYRAIDLDDKSHRVIYL